MMWFVAGFYCFILWLVFAKLKLLRFSLPLALLAGSVGPSAIAAVLFCAQYYHPMAASVLVVEKVVPITPQMTRPGRVTKIHVQPNQSIKKGDLLFEVDPIPYQNAIDQLTDAVNEADAGVKVAQSTVEVAAATIRRADADLKFATTERDREQELQENQAGSEAALDQAVTRYEQAAAGADQAQSGAQQATLSVELAKAKLSQAKISLAGAQYDLEQTTAVAPSDGFVTNLQLQVGTLVGGTGAQPVMSFVPEREDANRGVVVAMFAQKSFLLIKPKQYAEVVLDIYPGKVFTGKVLTTIDASGKGQLQAGGVLPTEIGTGAPTTFAVRILLDSSEDLRLPGGTAGTAAVYTEHVQIAGVPIMFVMRMQAWLNYIF